MAERIPVPELAMPYPAVGALSGCELEAGSGHFGLPGLHHPGCEQPADVSVDLDSAFCPACGLNVRISGAWVIDVLERGEDP